MSMSSLQAPAAPPVPVRRAALLMYAGGALSVVYNVLRVVFRDQVADVLRESLGDTPGADAAVEQVQHSGVGLIVVGLLTAGVWVLMARLCLAGHGWARVVTTLLSGLGVVAALVGLFSPSYLPLALINLVIGLIALMVIVSLWQRESTDYFAG